MFIRTENGEKAKVHASGGLRPVSSEKKIYLQKPHNSQPVSKNSL